MGKQVKIFTGYFLVGKSAKIETSRSYRYCIKNISHNSSSNNFCTFCGSQTILKEIKESYFSTMYAVELPEGVFPIYRDEGYDEIDEYLGVEGSTVEILFDNDIKNVGIEVNTHGVMYAPIPDELIASLKELVKYSELKFQYGTICVPQS
jgi:hypothetical protein